MGQMEDLRAFVLIVENESIGKAAEMEGIAKSAMSRKLRLLEERLGTGLITRTTRQWSLTSAGKSYFAHAQRIISALDEADAEIGNEQLDSGGDIVLAAPLHYGTQVLSERLVGFARDHPKIRLNVDFEDRFVDLVSEQYDLAIRISHPADSSLMARKIGETRHVFCASPGYLESASKITQPSDLRDHKIIQHGRAKRFKWRFCPKGERPTEVSLSSDFNSNNGDLLIGAALAGLGIVRVPDFLAETALNTGRLVRVLENCEPPPLQISMVYPATHHQPKRVRMLMDYILENPSGQT